MPLTKVRWLYSQYVPSTFYSILYSTYPTNDISLLYSAINFNCTLTCFLPCFYITIMWFCEMHFQTFLTLECFVTGLTLSRNLHFFNFCNNRAASRQSSWMTPFFSSFSHTVVSPVVSSWNILAAVRMVKSGRCMERWQLLHSLNIVKLMQL